MLARILYGLFAICFIWFAFTHWACVCVCSPHIHLPIAKSTNLFLFFVFVQNSHRIYVSDIGVLGMLAFVVCLKCPCLCIYHLVAVLNNWRVPERRSIHRLTRITGHPFRIWPIAVACCNTHWSCICGSFFSVWGAVC